MTVLVEKYIEFPFVYGSDDEALAYIADLMQLTDWQAICDVTYQDTHGAVVDCPDGLPELYFDDEMQVILFKVEKRFVGEQPTGAFTEAGEPLYEYVEEMRQQVRAVSFAPEREDDA